MTTSKQAIKAPRTSREAPSGDHLTAKIKVSDAIKAAVNAGVTELNSKLDMVLSIALTYLIGAHLCPAGKPADLNDVDAQITKGILTALKLPEGGSSTVANYRRTALDVYKMVAGVPKDDQGRFIPNKMGGNWGHPVSDIAKATDIKTAFTLFRDHVTAEACKATGTVRPTMASVEAWSRGKSQNGTVAIGGTPTVRTALDKIDNVQAAAKAKGFGTNLSKILAGRDSAGAAGTVSSLVQAVPNTETVEMLVIQAFERLVKLSPGTAVKVASKLTGIAAIAASNLPAQSTDAPKAKAAMEAHTAPQATTKAAEKVTAEHNATVRAKRGNPAKHTVA